MTAPVTDEDEVTVMETEAVYELHLADRCERCGAQAFVITAHPSGLFLWCGHHYAENENKLGPLKVLDHRDRINLTAY